MSLLNPAAWNGVGIVSFLIVFVAFFVMALFRGWIVLRVHHREIMAQNTRELDAMKQRSDKDAESIAKFADAAAVSTAAAEVTQKMMQSMRQLAEERTE
ncbi:putative phage protein [Gordonia polyisoprenivorans VH2]|uniref:Putative phage protein n=1 Tax=Gordonia polyisoprenivorans (strain DSM 44266 / VH2) TaxID=1112204 RepID=H6N3G7_GORPV|nr:hypothetical protein [Gordonia polyisoprenivorans]AFA72326.1 putative phage protein [Gordonia polyisoprenivorans VH2]